LEGFDPDLVDQLVQTTRELITDVHLNTSVEAVEKHSEHFIVSAASEEGEHRFETDLVVHGAGRVPDIDDLDLEAADVTHEKRGVTVNDFLQSVSNPGVYAAGDAAASSGLPLTPVASAEGHVVAKQHAERQSPQAELRWCSNRRLYRAASCFSGRARR